jgi:hypothetical protein
MNADQNLVNLRNGSAALTTSLLIFIHGVELALMSSPHRSLARRWMQGEPPGSFGQRDGRIVA